MECAYIDESQVGGTGSGLPYVLTASFAVGDTQDEVRDALRRLLPKNAKKLHWNRLTPDAQERVVGELLTLDLMHIVVVRETTIQEKPERSRRSCIQMLLYELASMDVEHAVFESRGSADDARDLKMLGALRSQRVVPTRFRVDHMPGPAEPLLWVPDVVNGAVGASIQHGGDHGFERQAWVTTTYQEYKA